MYWLLIGLGFPPLTLFTIELYTVSPPKWTITQKLSLCFTLLLHSSCFSGPGPPLIWRRKWQPTPVWTEEPGGLPSMGSHRVRHDWHDLAAAAASPLTVIILDKFIIFFPSHSNTVQFSSVAQSCLTLCNPMDWNTPGLKYSNEYSGLISFRIDWLDLLEVQGTLKSPLQHHSSKASVLQHSAFFIVQLLHPYMTTRKTMALTRQTFVDKVMSLLFNMLSRLVIAFSLKSKHLLISWLQSLSAVILEPKKIKSLTVSTVSPTICHEVMRPDAMILVFWMLRGFLFLFFFSINLFVLIRG